MIGACPRSRWLTVPPRADCRSPASRRRRQARRTRGVVAIVAGGSLGGLAVLDDVAGLKQHARGDLAPLRRAPQEELEIHAEVLVLLADGVGHHGFGLRIALDRQALLVPADRLRLLGQRSAQPRERTRLLGKLVRRLVVLVESHRFLLAICTSRRTVRGGPAPVHALAILLLGAVRAQTRAPATI